MRSEVRIFRYGTYKGIKEKGFLNYRDIKNLKHVMSELII